MGGGKVPLHAFFTLSLDENEWSLSHTVRTETKERSLCVLLAASFMGPRVSMDGERREMPTRSVHKLLCSLRYLRPNFGKSLVLLNVKIFTEI